MKKILSTASNLWEKLGLDKEKKDAEILKSKQDIEIHQFDPKVCKFEGKTKDGKPHGTGLYRCDKGKNQMRYKTKFLYGKQ